MYIIELFATIMAVMFVLIGICSLFVKHLKKMQKDMAKMPHIHWMAMGIISSVVAIFVLYHVWKKIDFTILFATVGASILLMKGLVFFMPNLAQETVKGVSKIPEHTLRLYYIATGLVGLIVLYILYAL